MSSPTAAVPQLTRCCAPFGFCAVWQKQADGGWRAELVATPHKKKILTMAVSRDGSMVATGVKGMTVALWSFNEDTPLNELSEQTFSTPERPLSMVFSPDGRYLTFGYPKGVLAYCDVREESGTVEHDEIFDLMELPSPENVGALAFSPDGRWLAAGLADGTVHLIGWNETNVSTSRVIYSITSPAPTASSFQAVVGLAWSSETTLIVAVDVGTGATSCLCCTYMADLKLSMNSEHWHHC